MEWSRDNRRQRAGKGLKDSNLGAGSTKLFRASGFHLLASWALCPKAEELRALAALDIGFTLAARASFG
jgi:hypothetical protein